MHENALKYWIEGPADKMCLLIRNGDLVKNGVGLTTWTLPGDKFVSFPVQMQQVDFSAD